MNVYECFRCNQICSYAHDAERDTPCPYCGNYNTLIEIDVEKESAAEPPRDSSFQENVDG